MSKKSASYEYEVRITLQTDDPMGVVVAVMEGQAIFPFPKSPNVKYEAKECFISSDTVRFVNRKATINPSRSGPLVELVKAANGKGYKLATKLATER